MRQILVVTVRYGLFLRESGRTEDARAAFQRAIQMTIEAAGAEHELTRSLALEVAGVHISDGEYERAEALLLPMVESRSNLEGIELLVTLYRTWNQEQPGDGHDQDLAHWQAVVQALELENEGSVGRE